MRRVKQVAKWSVIGLGGLLAVIAVTVMLGFGWLRSDGGRDWLARQIENAASTPGEMQLSIGEIGGALPQSLIARDIVLSDADGSFLTVASLEIDWQPWQLLSRTVAVQRIELGAVDLARLPTAQPEAATEEDGGDPRALLDFPLKIRLGRLAADEIAIGQPVLGQAARFSLDGEARRRDDGNLSARLDLERLDSIGDRLAATVSYVPRSDLLTANLNVAMARGGLLAALLNMPELPAADLKLAGSGPLADWSGDITLALGDLAAAQVDIGLQRRDGGDLAFRLQGGSDVRPPEESDLWRLVAGHTTIDLAGAWQNGRRLQLDRLALGNDRLRLTLQGDVVPEDEALDLKLLATADDASALARLATLDSLRSLDAEIGVTGSFGRPQATLDLRAAGLAGPGIAAETVTLTGTVTGERDLLGPAPLLALGLEGRLDAPRLPGQDAVNQVLGDSVPLGFAGRLDLDSLVLEIARLEVAAGGTTLSASGPFNLGDGSAELAATAEVAELAALRPLTGIGLRGRTRLAGPVTLERFGARIAADLQGRWEKPGSDIGLITAAAGQGLDLTMRLAIADGDIRIEEAAARSPATELAASVTVAGGALRDGRYTLRLADAAALAGELGVATAGPAAVEGTIAGPFDALQIDGSASLGQLTIAEQTLKEISARYDLRLSGADIDGPIEVAFASPFGPAEAGTELQLRRDAVTLADLSARLPQTTVSGQVSMPLDGGEPSADLTGEVGDLGQWLKLAGFTGSGKGRIAVALNQPGASAPLIASVDLSGASFRPEPDAVPLTAERVTVKVEGQDPAFAEPGRIDLAATNLRWDRLALERTDVAVRGTLNALDITLDSKGHWMQPLELSAAARVTRQADTTTVALERASGRAFGQPLELRRQATLTLAPDVTQLEGLALTSGDASLTADAALGQDRIMVKAALESLPLSAADPFWESGLAGQLSAAVDLEGSFAAPRGSAQLTASGLRPRDNKDMPALQFTSSADWQGGRLKAEGQLGGDAVAAARFSADAPLRMTADGAIELPPREPLSGRLDWSGDIKTLLLFVPLPEHRLDGKAEIAISLDGTLEAPTADGRIALAEGYYENLETGTLLRDLALTAEVSRERVTLAHLAAVDGDGGKVSGEGELALDPARDFPFDVAINLDKFHAVRRDDVTAVASGRVRLDGDVTAPRVEGRFTTETVEVSLANDLPPTVVSLDVVEVKDGVVQQPPQEAESDASPVDAVLDVVVEMPRRVFVRGRGLDSEWAGRLSVQGPAASPAVTGTLDVVRGQLSIVGKVFTLKAGKVTLPEGADTEPALDVTAEHEGRDLTVTARLRGPASRPELELSSVPPVPRDEIISRVLFDKSAAQLSAVEAAQLAIALRELSGSGGGTDILGLARRTLGVDVLRIETAEGDAPALEAGKYLSEDVYVGVKQGAGSQSTAASVEVELTPNITLESEMTGQGVNKSGVRFQWDY